MNTSHECCVAKEYAHAILEWGRAIQGHNESIQRFLEVRTYISFFVYLLQLSFSLIFSITLIFFAHYGSTNWNAFDYDSASPTSPSNIWCFSITEPLS
jgi:hypothetical protein